MANWKKIITSGSNAHLNHISASGKISSSGGFIGDLTGDLTGQASTVENALTAGGGLNNGGGTFTGGTARTFSVDSASMGAFFSASMNSFTTAGTGSFNRIMVDGDISASGGLYGQVSTAAQTNITSLLATDIKIGEDDQTKIDFETDDEIHFYAANVEQVYLADNIFGPQSDSDVDLGTTGVRWKDAYIDTITTTGNITSAGTGSFDRIMVDGEISASGTGSFAGLNIGGGLFTSASLASLGSGGGTTTAALTAGGGLNNGGGTFNGGTARTFSVNSASMGAFFSASMNNFTTTGTGSFNRILVDGDISASGGLYGTLQTVAQTNITSVGALNGGTITSGFGNINNGSSTITTTGTVSAGRVNTTGGVHVGGTGDPGADNLIVDGTSILTGNVTIAGDLAVNGTTTTIASTNTEVKDQFIFLATGSAGTNLDAGIVVQSGSAVDSGSALYHDISDQRWSVAKGVAKDHLGATQGPTQYVTTVGVSANNPQTAAGVGASGSYGPGEMHVNTSTGDIWVRVAD